MTEFVYNNAKNASMGHTIFELNHGYYSSISYKEDVHPQSWSKLVDRPANKLKKFTTFCRKNL